MINQSMILNSMINYSMINYFMINYFMISFIYLFTEFIFIRHFDLNLYFNHHLRNLKAINLHLIHLFFHLMF